LAIPVLLILAVLWAAVLVPPVLRSRSESRRRDSVGDFTSQLSALSGQRARRDRSLHAVGTPAPMSPAQKRRRDILIILAGAAMASLLLVVILRNPLLWSVQVLADVLLVVYLLLLVRFKRRSSLAALQKGIDTWPPVSKSIRSVSHPRVPPRPDLAPLSTADSSLPRAAAR
jgi:Flp pilus assembly protein TadB